MTSKAPIKRTFKLKDNLLSSPYDLCIERLRFFTEIYKIHENEPVIIKKAKAIAHTLKNMTIFIRDGELLVGNETSKNLGEKLTFELHSFRGFTDKESLKQLGERKPQPFHISDEDVEVLMKMIPFWKGKSLYGDIIYKRMQDEKIIKRDDNIAASAPNIAVMTGTNEGHICAGYKKLLKLGYSGIIKEAEHFQERIEQDDPEFKEKHAFYDAVKIYYHAAIEFALRYSKLAHEMAKREKDIKIKNEFNSIAECMEAISKRAPFSFYEAIQCIWFTQNIANIIYYRSVLALGRLDQILWSYYYKDLKENKITKDFALELIEELNLKLTWNCTLLPTNYTAAANAIGLNTQTITISGIDKQGKDATNELSYLFLEAYKNIKSLTSDLSIRIHKNTPKEFFLEALKVFRSTSGIAFYNDDIIVPALNKAGYSLDDARNYVIIGCVEPTSQGNTFAATGHMFLNLPGVLELTLNNGYSHFSGQIDGLQTGDPVSFKTYKDLYDAFKQQIQFNIKKAAQIANLMDNEAMKWDQQPFISATLEDCLEKGKDYTQGGAKYNFSSITAFSFASLVNSMYNIKKVVYDQKLISLPELINILNSNFKKQNVFRKKLLNKYQKWGNDQEEIDTMAVDLWDLYCKEVVKHRPLRGGRFNPGCYTMGIHILEGLITMASADGRKAFQPLSNSLSPTNQTERNGITAALNSIAKLNYTLATNGVAVNVRFHPQNLEGEQRLEKFNFLLKTYFEKGGMQIQPTVVSTETLRDAQKHPENYADLIVKVGGYNANFTDLGTAIQNDIIDRLEINL